MVAVIFEFTPAEGRFTDYMALVATREERDYTMDERAQAPEASVRVHG